MSKKFNSKTLSRLIAIATPEKRNLYWGFLFLVLSSGAGLSYPQLVRWMIDQVIQPKRDDLLLPAVGFLFFAFVIQGVFGSLRYYLFTLSGERIVLKLRQKLYEKILSNEIAFFDQWRTGDLMSRLASDCTTLQNTVSVNISQGLRNLGQVIGGFGFMFYTSWKLSLLMFALVPPIALAAFYFGKKIRSFSKVFQESLAEASVVAEETISGVRTVKSFVQESAEAKRYSLSLETSLMAAKARTRSIADFMTLALVAGFGAVCFVLWYGGREVIHSNLSIGDLTQFLLYLMIVAIGVGSLGSLWGDMMSGIGASDRVFELIERESAENLLGDSINDVSQSVEFNQVLFSYPSRTDTNVLKNISFKIKVGEVAAFVGPSGSGKTTLGYLLSRFYVPQGGEIQIDQKNINLFNLKSLREVIGIVSQEPVLISDTIEQNIRYAKRDASDQEVFAAAGAANALEFIQRFPEGFKTKVGEKGIQLSGGQKQRIAIARALLKNPKILILDEATSNLDTASEHLVQEALQHLMKGRTTLVIAHRLATIKDANKIFVLSNGQISQQGTHDELVLETNGIYYQLLQRQFE